MYGDFKFLAAISNLIPPYTEKNHLNQPPYSLVSSLLAMTILKQNVEFWMEALTAVVAPTNCRTTHSKVKYYSCCHKLRDDAYDFEF